MRVFKPPEKVVLAPGSRVMFLAGSIKMGTSVDWQAELTTALGDRDVCVLNPRRDAWDATWRQAIDNPVFKEQVEWELDGLDRADVIAMWFAPDTKAPITLLELGLHVRGGNSNLVVGCPDGYWRKGNVSVVCARFGVRVLDDWASFVAEVCRRVG